MLIQHFPPIFNDDTIRFFNIHSHVTIHLTTISARWCPGGFGGGDSSHHPRSAEAEHPGTWINWELETNVACAREEI